MSYELFELFVKEIQDTNIMNNVGNNLSFCSLKPLLDESSLPGLL